MPSANFSQLTGLVTTTGGANELERLMLSVRRHAPGLRVMAAVGGSSLLRADMDCIPAPAKGGVAAARNALLARVRTPYFAVLSDELELHGATHLERLLEATSQNRYDLTAGELVRCERRFWIFSRRTPSPGHGVFIDEGDMVRADRNVGPAIDGLRDCDLVQPFFVARTDKIRSMGGWEWRLTVGEREEFFVRARRYGVRVGLCSDATAWHWPSANGAAVDTPAQRELAAGKMGVARFVDLEGRSYDAPARAQAA